MSTMKSVALMMAIAGAAMMNGPRRTPMPSERKKGPQPLPQSFFNPQVHKGHQTESIELEFTRWSKDIWRIRVMFTFSNPKTRLKKIKQLQGQLQEYLNNTEHKYLKQFNQFIQIETQP
jgi:hypothetical protein